MKSYITVIPSAVHSLLLHADRLTGRTKLIGTLLQIFVAIVSKMDIEFLLLMLIHDSLISVSKEAAKY